jgi:hypothetical protein
MSNKISIEERRHLPGEGPTIKRSLLYFRLEAAFMFAVTLYLYFLVHGNWLLYVPLWFAFDLSLLGYVLGGRSAAFIYNLVHSFILPSVLAVVGLLSHSHWVMVVTVVWFSHITLDRALGYGLKEGADFARTHLSGSAAGFGQLTEKEVQR